MLFVSPGAHLSNEIFFISLALRLVMDCCRYVLFSRMIQCFVEEVSIRAELLTFN